MVAYLTSLNSNQRDRQHRSSSPVNTTLTPSSSCRFCSPLHSLPRMDGQGEDGSPIAKRRKLEFAAHHTNIALPLSEPQEVGKGLNKPISPPPARHLRSRTPTPSTPRVEADAHGPHLRETPALATSSSKPQGGRRPTEYISSPVQLTKIRDLAPHQNVDAVGLGELLGDPMIKECWNFNFLFDINFVM